MIPHSIVVAESMEAEKSSLTPILTEINASIIVARAEAVSPSNHISAFRPENDELVEDSGAELCSGPASDQPNQRRDGIQPRCRLSVRIGGISHMVSAEMSDVKPERNAPNSGGCEVVDGRHSLTELGSTLLEAPPSAQ